MIDRHELRVLLEGFEDGKVAPGEVGNARAQFCTQFFCCIPADRLSIPRFTIVCRQHWLTDAEVNSVMSQYDQKGVPAVVSITGKWPRHDVRTAHSNL